MLSNLNQQQKKCVTFGTGPLLVLAGPGSGKTHTLTKRIQYLTGKLSVPDRKILVITFTREAALAMHRRYDRIEPDNQVVFGTFHSFFFSILTKESPQKINLISEKDKFKIIIPVMVKLMSVFDPSYSKMHIREDAEWLLEAISVYKSTGSEDKAKEKIPYPWTDLFMQVFKNYEEIKAGTDVIDFDDMIYLCRELFKDNNILKKYRKMFSHILIDEFQDINPMQYEVVKMLSEPPYNLFVVGDDDQSIYGFRGAEPECLFKFVEDFEAQVISLEVNYRSGNEIILASEKVISQNPKRFEKKMRASEMTKQSSVKVFGFDKVEEEAAFITELLKAEPSVSTAVLFRTNAQMVPYEFYLRKRGVEPLTRGKKEKLSENEYVCDLKAYLGYAATGNTGDLMRIINKPSRCVSKSCITGGEKLTIRELIEEFEELKGISLMEESLEKLKKLERDMLTIGKLGLHGAISYILKACDYLNYAKKSCRSENSREEVENLLLLIMNESRNYKTFDELINSIDAQKTKAENGLMVHCMTCHAAKGLEFERVIIPDCNERTFPHGLYPSEKSVEEERRLFYVAMTRARSSLIMLYLENKENPDRRRSRFLNQLIV